MGTAIIRYAPLPFALTVVGVLTLEFAARALPFGFLLSTGTIRVAQAGLIIGASMKWPAGAPLPGINPMEFRKGIRQGILWSAGSGFFAGVIGFGLWLAQINPFDLIRVGLPSNQVHLALFFLVGGVMGPIAEELFFRGAVYGFFRKWGIAAAVLVSTGLFVLAHGINGFGVTQLVGGAVFAVIYEYEKNIISPMIVHISGNLALFSLGFF